MPGGVHPGFHVRYQYGDLPYALHPSGQYAGRCYRVYPRVGAFIGCIVGALFILVDNPLQAVTFVGMFLVLQQIENNLIYPRVVGTSIGLPGMWVLLAVAVGGEFMGVAGMFLMIPLSSVLYTLLRERTNKRLSSMTVDEEKLKEQPPELRSRFKEKRVIRKLKFKNIFKKK